MWTLWERRLVHQEIGLCFTTLYLLTFYFRKVSIIVLSFKVLDYQVFNVIFKKITVFYFYRSTYT